MKTGPWKAPNPTALLRSVIPELQQLLGWDQGVLDDGREGGLGRTRPHLFFIPIISYFLPPSKLNLGCFSCDFSWWESLFFVDFPSLPVSSSVIWLNCFIHTLTLPSSCSLPSLVFSSKVPALSSSPPAQVPINSCGVQIPQFGGKWGLLWPPFPEEVFNSHSCPSQCFPGLVKLAAPTLLHFPQGSLVHLHFGGGDFFLKNKRPGVDSQAVAPTVGFGIQSEVLKGRYLHVLGA